MIIKPRYNGPQFWDGGKSLDLYFARDKSLDPRITFTRASSGTYWDASGVLQTATTDEPRFDHNPVTGESLGLLIEGAATNLFTYSEDFSNAAWTKDSCTITSNSAIAPDGTLTMDELVLTGTDGSIYTGFSGVTGTVTQSAFVKKNTADTVYFIYNSTSNKAVFNPNTGTVVSVVGGAASIEDVGNDTYRIKFTPTHATTARSYIGATGTTGESVFIWGAQLETGSRASSYIKTEASTVTRAADSASMTGTNFSSWYNQAEGTFVIEFEAGGAGDEFPLSVGQENVNEIAPYRNNSANDMYLYATASSVTQTNIAIGDYPASGGCKFAFSYGSAAVDAAVDGAASVGATPITIPLVSDLYIGGRSPGTNPLNGTIKRLAYYPKRLTNGNLVELTDGSVRG